jgi:hypothetical protein
MGIERGSTRWHSVENSLDRRCYGPVEEARNGWNTIYSMFTKKKIQKNLGQILPTFKLSFYFNEYSVFIYGFAD